MPKCLSTENVTKRDQELDEIKNWLSKCVDNMMRPIQIIEQIVTVSSKVSFLKKEMLPMKNGGNVGKVSVV